jgi:LysR family transcriptional regulator, transcriptional activator of nhaA
MPQLNYKHLRYFWAVAHEGNLTRTAEQMNVSQSALSMQIAKLEDELGHSLFERRGRQLLLTEAGRIALDHADTIFAAGAELIGTLGEQRSKLRQVLRVGAIATLSRNFQIGFLRPLLERNDVELVLRSGNYAALLSALEAHRLDVVLTNAALTRDEATPWVAHRIAEQPVSVIGSRGFDAAGRALPELLASEPLIAPTPENSIRAGFDALVERLGIRPTFVVEADDMAVLRLIARERTGLAILPPIVVRDELSSGVLSEITRLPDLVETFHAITLRRRFPNPLLRELLGDLEARERFGVHADNTDQAMS